MAKFKSAQIIGNRVKIFHSDRLEKSDAMIRIKKGKDVYGNRSNARTLALALSEGQGCWHDSPHVIGGYRHYHDINRKYKGHIFYGEPGLGG